MVYHGIMIIDKGRGYSIMRNRGALIFGLILIAIGSMSLLSSIGIISISWGQVWPLVILLAGLLFELSFFVNGCKEPGLLMPGGVLLTYGILFYYCSANGYSWMGKLWPLFLLGPAVGLFQVYIFGTREKGLLVPGGILGGLSLIFLLSNFTTLDIGSLLFPVILIIVGFVILINGGRKV